MLEETNRKFVWTKRLNNTKWILTLLIVLYHIPVPANSSGFQYTTLLYTKDLGDCVVTLFSLISGFLFFYNAHNFSDIYAKMKRRVWTLLVPYMMWNIINSLYLILRSNGISGFIKGIITTNWVKNIILWDSSPHLWYVFMLIFWTALAPLLFITYKDKRLLAVLLLSQVIYCVYKGSNILASRHTYILYTWGGLVGTIFPNLFNKWGVFDKKKRKITFYICLIIYIVIRLPYNNITNNGILVWCYAARSIFLLLALMNAPFEYVGIKTGYAFSFWTFAIHYYLDAIISDYIFKWVPIPIAQILSWVIVFSLAIASGMILKYVSPKLFLILTGNRCNNNSTKNTVF